MHCVSRFTSTLQGSGGVSRRWKVPERDCQKDPTVEGLEGCDTRATHYAASASGWQGVTPRPHACSQAGTRRAEARVWVCWCVARSLVSVGEGREEQEGRGAPIQATRELIAQGWGSQGHRATCPPRWSPRVRRGTGPGPRTHPSPPPGSPARPHSQHDPRDVQPHRDAPVFEGGGDEAAEGERRHHAQREGEERVRARQDGVHRDALPSGALSPTPVPRLRFPAAPLPTSPLPPAHPVRTFRERAPPPPRPLSGARHLPGARTLPPSGTHPPRGRARAGGRGSQSVRQSAVSTAVGFGHRSPASSRAHSLGS